MSDMQKSRQIDCGRQCMYGMVGETKMYQDKRVTDWSADSALDLHPQFDVLKKDSNEGGPGWDISVCGWRANQSRVCTCSLIFHQVRLGNCPQQWQLMRHPRHTRQLSYSVWMSERGGLTSDGSELRKSYFVRAVIARHRPVRAPNLNARRDFAVKGVLSARTSVERLLCVQSWCDNQILISQKWSWKGGMRTCQCGVCTFHTGDWGGLLSCTSAGRQTAKIVINASVGEENPTINAWGDDVDHIPIGYTEICWLSHICHTCSDSYRIWRRKLAVRETPTQNEKEILDFAGSHQTSDYVNECKQGEVSLSHSWWCGPGELPL